MDYDSATPKRCLRMISDVLGVPVERFYEAAIQSGSADAEECLRLWLKLRTDKGRASVLNHLRQTLADEAS